MSYLFIYLFNNLLLMPACGMAGTVENSNMLKAWSLASKELVIWQGRQTPTQLAREGREEAGEVNIQETSNRVQ